MQTSPDSGVQTRTFRRGVDLPSLLQQLGHIDLVPDPANASGSLFRSQLRRLCFFDLLPLHRKLHCSQCSLTLGLMLFAGPAVGWAALLPRSLEEIVGAEVPLGWAKLMGEHVYMFPWFGPFYIGVAFVAVPILLYFASLVLDFGIPGVIANLVLDVIIVGGAFAMIKNFVKIYSAVTGKAPPENSGAEAAPTAV